MKMCHNDEAIIIRLEIQGASTSSVWIVNNSDIKEPQFALSPHEICLRRAVNFADCRLICLSSSEGIIKISSQIGRRVHVSQ